MDLLQSSALFWLVVLAYGEYVNNGSSAPESSKTENNRPTRSYGFNAFGYAKHFPVGFPSQVSHEHVPSAASKPARPKATEDPRTEESRYNAADSAERYERRPDKLEDAVNNDDGDDDGDDYNRVKKTKEVSIKTDISLVPKERDKSLDPVYQSQQQSRGPRVVRPMRDLSILVRNPHRPLIITRQVPFHWAPRQPHQHHHHRRPVRPPMMPSHRKPCKPKKKKPKEHCHRHKPKKPKKKPKEHCHHHKPKKPHHKKLIYYAPIPTMPVNGYFYGSKNTGKLIVPTSTTPAANSYSVEESPDTEDMAENLEDDQPFHSEIEDDVESHRLGEPLETYDDEDPSESKAVKAVKTG
ncbi:uncharacterized protein LOC126846420 [Adelges cooleyi]|uniref:uncharacterized protein LOC126846420 n=1 Tax=Adelges cooleyi TaxID=133065 RepID=UPI00217F407A|nr:uncharacterized protein LOC126846420 [Adelges cooleyi]